MSMIDLASWLGSRGRLGLPGIALNFLDLVDEEKAKKNYDKPDAP